MARERKSTILCINPRPDESPYLSINRAELLVYRGQAAFFEDPQDHRKKLRYLEHYEQMRLRAEITAVCEKAIDDAMIDNGKKVVYWNGANPESCYPPGVVRS